MAAMTVLTTQRLVLREMTGADLDHIAALFGDEEVMRYYPKPMTREESHAWVAWNQRLYRSLGFGLWAMIVRDTGELRLPLCPLDAAGEARIASTLRAYGLLR